MKGSLVMEDDVVEETVHLQAAVERKENGDIENFVRRRPMTTAALTRAGADVG
jgi:hypothetical protein